MKKARHTIYYLLFVLLFVSFVFSFNIYLDSKNNKLNVIMISVDLLRYDYVGLLSSEHNLTPNIDSFFKDAFVFKNAYSSSGLTYPSNFAILTGTESIINNNPTSKGLYCDNNTNYKEGYPDFIRFIYWANHDGRLLSAMPTIAQVLVKNHYYTLNVNFDFNFNSGRCAGLDRGFLKSVDIYNDPVLFDDQIDILLRELDLAKSKPFFAFFRSNSLHTNMRIAPKDKVETFLPTYSLIRYSPYGQYYTKENQYQLANYNLSEREVVKKSPKYDHYEGLQVLDGPFNKTGSDVLYLVEDYQGNISNFTYKDRDDLIINYAEQVKYIDEGLGRLFESLRKRGILNKTIIIFYSDHGDGFGENKRFGHGTPYDAVIHVPLLIFYPGKSGRFVDNYVSTVDLSKTLYTVLNITPKHKLVTYSFASLFDSDSEYDRRYVVGKGYFREGDLKLINFELYNTTADPYEYNDLDGSYFNKKVELSFAESVFFKEQLSYIAEMKRYFNIT